MSETLIVLADGQRMGRIEAKGRRLGFVYDSEWRNSPRAYPLSLSMPLVVPEHGHRVVESFLWGLLPDNDTTLSRWGRKFQVSPRNPFKLISHVGEDCAGAVQFVRPERSADMLSRSKAPRVHWLAKKDVAERMRWLAEDASATRAAGDEGQFSLAGAQPKTAFIHDPAAKRWGVPGGRTPTTHILKPATGEFEGFTQNEHFCLRLAGSLGLPVTKSWIEDFAGLPVIVVERYDRVVQRGRAHRLHQEDMCQAMGIRPQSKYQNQGGPSPKDVAEILWDQATQPRADVLRFADALVFNWLVAGTDAHAKNYSLLLSGHAAARLAPLYDMASSIPYPRQIDPRKAKLAMKIGRHYRIREVTRRDWDRCARELRLRPGELHERMDSMMARLPDAALSVAAEMNKEGLTHPVVTSLADRLPLWIKKQQQQLAKKHGQHRGLRLRHLSPSGSWGQRARTLRLQTG